MLLYAIFSKLSLCLQAVALSRSNTISDKVSMFLDSGYCKRKLSCQPYELVFSVDNYW